MKELTLRQIEVVRAVMMAGTINGAASLLNVSAPGISRLVRHTEESLGLRLFDRRGGLFMPSAEAVRIFDQIGQVYKDVENLNLVVASLQRGGGAGLAFASAPSIAQVIAARTVRRVRQRYPELFVDLNILKIEETVDYLLLERGEFVVMSSPIDGAGIESEEIATGVLLAIVPDGHPLAGRAEVSVHDLAREPMIGVDPEDPYGRILLQPFRDAGIDLHHAMRGRFAQTVISMVRHGLGVAVIDEFSVAELHMPGLVRLPLREAATITAYIARRKDHAPSAFADHAAAQMRRELLAAMADRPWERPSSERPA